MTLPGTILLIIFVIFPIIGIYIAFVEFRPLPEAGFFESLFSSRFVGFTMFNDIFSRPDFGRAVGNTIIIAAAKLVLQTIAGIGLALLLNEIGTRFAAGRFAKKIFQSMYFVPFFISWVLLGSIVIDMFSVDGIINTIFRSDISFFSDPELFRIIAILSDVWKNMGYQAIFFLAAITGVNMTLYEAAKVDGANYWKQCIHVTIPGIMPIIILVSVLNIGNIMNAGFEQILVLYNPAVYSTGDILDTLAYRVAFFDTSLDMFSFSTAIGLFRSVVACFFFVISYTFAAKKLNYNIL